MPDQGHLELLALGDRVALDELAVGVADHEVGLVGEDQRTHVPEVLADVDLGLLAVGRRLEQLHHLLAPALVAVVAQDVGRLGAQLQQELGQAHDEVGVAPEGEALAVQPGVRVGHHVDQPAALLLQRRGDRLAGQLRDLHQQLVGPLQAHRDWQLGDVVVPGPLDVLGGLLELPGLEQQGRDGVGGVLDLVLRGAAGIHPELAVGGRVEDLFRVGQEGVIDVHLA